MFQVVQDPLGVRLWALIVYLHQYLACLSLLIPEHLISKHSPSLDHVSVTSRQHLDLNGLLSPRLIFNVRLHSFLLVLGKLALLPQRDDQAVEL